MKASKVPNTAPIIFISVEKFGTMQTTNPLSVTNINRIIMGSILMVDWALLDGVWLKPAHFLCSILVTGNIIIGYEKNKEMQRNILTRAAKSMNVEDSSESKLRVIISLVSGPNDR